MFKNQLKTFILLGGLTALLLSAGQLMGGHVGVVIALVFSFFMNIIAYWFSDKIILNMYKAEEIFENHHSGLYEIIEKLVRRAGIPMAKVYIVPDKAPNAFATGRNPEHAAVAATQGLIEILDQDELEAVIAHELSHIKNRDTLISTISATVVSAIMHIVTIAQWTALFGGLNGDDDDSSGDIIGTIMMIILAPLAAMLIQAGISRSREYMADSGSKGLLRTGVPLANALRKIENVASRGVKASAGVSTAHLFIINPLNSNSVSTLFSTHPSTEDRINKLISY